MQPYRRTIFWIFSIATLHILAACGPAASADKAPSPEQIKQWVIDLSSDRFIDREFATQELSKVGMSAIGPILQSIPQGDVESITRAVHILREVALGDDEQASTAGQVALQQIADSDNPQASRRALGALSKFSAVRQDRAIAELKKAGVLLTNETVTVGRAFVFEVPTVNLEEFDGKPEDLSKLRWLTDFRNVKMSGKKITDECVAQVAAMKNLHYVSIKRAAITDKAIEHLTATKGIQQFVVMYCQITDQAVDKLALHKTVTEMKLFGTKITKDGATKLAQSIANLDHRHGAFLGVGCETHELGCMIRIVHATSAAANAGIRQGDILTKFNGEFAKDFETLTTLIGKYEGGTTVEVEILRGEEKLKKSIKLGEWE